MAPLCRRLLLLGGLSLLLYGAVLVLSFQFDPETQVGPILTVVGLLGVATLLYWFALGLVVRAGAAAETPGVLRTVVLLAAAFRLVLLASQPIQEIDFYRYLWDGRVLAEGHNPYRYSPFQVEDVGFDDPGGERSQWWTLSRTSPAVETIFQRVHHRGVPTVYPPLAQAVFAVAALLTPAAAPVWAHVLVLKVLIVGFDLATLFVLAALLRAVRLPAAWCLAYGWCPLVMKEFANSGHLDAIAVFLTTAAALCLVRARFTPALALLGLAVLAKSYPVVLLPVVVAYLLAKVGWRALGPVAVFAGVVVAGYLPFVERARKSEEVTSHPGTGLQRFLTEWETNDLLFMVVYQNLRTDQAGPAEEPGQDRPPKAVRPGQDRPPEAARTGEPWYVVVPAEWRQELHQDVLARLEPELPFPPRPAFVLTQGLMGLALLGLTGWWAWGVYRHPEGRSLLLAVFLTLDWGWLLSSACNPWYLIWALPFMVFAGRWSWFLLPGLTLLYYVGFWLERQPETGWKMVEPWLVWVEFVPFYLVLAMECWLSRRIRAGAPPAPTVKVEATDAA